MKRKPAGNETQDSRAPEAKALLWLGGPALFGFLACQVPESGPVAPGPGGDTAGTEATSGPAGPGNAADSGKTGPAPGRIPDTRIVVREEPGPAGVLEPVRSIPYPGQPCDSARGYFACTLDKVLLRCENGTRVEVAGGHYSQGGAIVFQNWDCRENDTLPRYSVVSMGFNGSDAASRALPRIRHFLRPRA